MADNSSSVNISWLGIGMGNILAMLLSWDKWHNAIWCVIHGIFGWFYVIYYWLNFR